MKRIAFLLFIFVTNYMVGQNVINGVVVDESAVPLPGANVAVLGTTVGTTTDFDGNFSIQTEKETGQIEVSFIGYRTLRVSFDFNGTNSTDLGQIRLQNDDNSLDEVLLVSRGVTDLARDRETPVAVSNISSSQILERLGNQELPQILNTTPSVYATQGGGGFGDSQISIRGFESRNIAVLVNGMPVNDMEGGTVYFSNWTGLQDVTSAIQVQRGLGSSKLAIASVGGTMNFITRSSDMRQGGIVRMGIGNDDYLKTSVSYNTGLMDNGLSVSALFNRQAGSTWVENTKYESYSYFLALGYKINEKHNLQFMVTSAPQWHNQRTYANSISNYIRYNPKDDGKPYREYNSDYGYRTVGGKRVAIPNRMNYYAKPVMMLNWDWDINEKSSLNTVAYMSNGRGGGTGDLGKLDGSYATGFVDDSGHFDFDEIYEKNGQVDVVASDPGSTLVRRTSINSHNWYGILSNFTHEIDDNWKFSVGTDDRYYYGYHYQQVTDLYGAKGYKDDSNRNLSEPTIVGPDDLVSSKKLSWSPFGSSVPSISDRIGYSNDGEVLWYSGFGQFEYTSDKLSAFVQGSVSNQAFQRIDNFVKDGEDIQQEETVYRKTGFKNISGYNIKTGANYNINDHHNVFFNVGYYSKQPFMNAVYPSNEQVLNPVLTNEKISSYELGYGFRSSKFDANANLYRTQWKDRQLRRFMDFEDPSGAVDQEGNPIKIQGYSEINGITQIHMGAEVDFTYYPYDFLEFNGSFSLGDYHYKGNAQGRNFDENNNPLGGTEEVTLYLDKVKVGGTAGSIPQLGATLGFTAKPTRDLRVYGNWRYVDRVYSNLDVSSFDEPGNQALKLPSFNLFDIGASYKLRLNNTKEYFMIGVNVYNLFDTFYIANGSTSFQPREKSYFKDDPAKGTAQEQYDAYRDSFYKGIDPANRVYFGAPRTWSASLAFHF